MSTLTVPQADAYNDSDIFSELFQSAPLDGFGGGGGSVGGIGGGGVGGIGVGVGAGVGGVTGGGGGFSSGGTQPVSAPPPSRAAPTGGHMYVNTSASMGGSRPSSRQSHNSTPTPHPPSLPSFSPAAAAGFQISPPGSGDFGRPSPAGDTDDGPLKGLLGPRSVSSDTLGDTKDGLLQVSAGEGGREGKWQPVDRLSGWSVVCGR